MKRRKGCFAFLFTTSIIIGTLIGAIIGEVIKFPWPPNATSTPLPTATPTPDLNNLTILFIGVDDLNAETPHLISTWIVQQENHRENNVTDIHLTLRTLYPLLPAMVTTEELENYSQPHPPITVNLDDLSTLISLPLFNQPNVSWEQIVILDEYFMHNAILQIDGPTTGPPATPSPTMFDKPWDSPELTYEQQSAILKILCSEPNAYYLFPVADKLIKLHPEHIKSTLTAEELFRFWQFNVNIGSDFTVTCDFFPKK